MGVPSLRLSFLGATGTVTGSRYLVETPGGCLLVDCGLFQGYKTLRLRNWRPLPVDPSRLDGVVLTHAHLDHSGYLPRLVRDGFRGPIWCSAPTAALCRVLLPDSARLLEEEASYANRAGSSKHHPAEPLYREEDAAHALGLLQVVPFDGPFSPGAGVTATLRRQGHILGAASVLIEHEGQRVLFSGDIGRDDDEVMKAPEPPMAADWIVVESTYGNRLHGTTTVEDELEQVLERVLARRGVVVIPAFAVGRAQLMLHAIDSLMSQGRVPEAPLYLNSPMARSVTALYSDFPHEHRLTTDQLKSLRNRTRLVDSVEQSKALNRQHGPMVILSASGMATGGRVLHHLIAFAPDSRNAIVLSGYQAGGTRGATLASGARSVRIFGHNVAVNAEVVQLHAASAHADADGLIAWLRQSPSTPRSVFVTHGEPDAADALRARIEHELHWNAEVPDYLQAVPLETEAAPMAAFASGAGRG